MKLISTASCTPTRLVGLYRSGALDVLRRSRHDVQRVSAGLSGYYQRRSLSLVLYGYSRSLIFFYLFRPPVGYDSPSLIARLALRGLHVIGGVLYVRYLTLFCRQTGRVTLSSFNSLLLRGTMDDQSMANVRRAILS